MHPESYFILKIAHVISATLVFAASILMPVYLHYTHKAGETAIYRNAITLAFRLGLFIVIPLAFFQMLTGFALIGIMQYPIQLLWVWSTAVGFFLFLLGQLAAVYQLKQMRLGRPNAVKRWRLIVIISFVILLYMLFMMSNIPGSPPS